MKRSSSSISCERVLPASDDADATDEFSMATDSAADGQGGKSGEEEEEEEGDRGEWPVKKQQKESEFKLFKSGFVVAILLSFSYLVLSDNHQWGHKN